MAAYPILAPETPLAHPVRILTTPATLRHRLDALVLNAPQTAFTFPFRITPAIERNPVRGRRGNHQDSSHQYHEKRLHLDHGCCSCGSDFWIDFKEDTGFVAVGCFEFRTVNFLAPMSSRCLSGARRLYRETSASNSTRKQSQRSM